MPMRVLCEKCTAAYTLPDARLVPGRLVQFTCRHCHERITVAVPNSSAPAASAAVAPAPAEASHDDVDDGVFWFIAGKDSQPERRSGAEIAAAVTARTVRSQTLLWRKGMAEWQPAGSLVEWQAALREAAGSGTSRGIAAQTSGAAPSAGQKPAWTMRSTDDPNSDSAQVAMKLPTLWVATEAPETRSPEAQKSASLTVRPSPQARAILARDPDTTEDEAFAPEAPARKPKGAKSSRTQWSDPNDPADQTPYEPVPTSDASDWRRVALAALGMALVALIVSGVLAWRLHAVSSQMVTLRALPAPSTAPLAPAAAPTEP